MDDRARRVSDRLVELVQVIFAFVLAQGLADNRDVLLHLKSHWIALIALIGIYVTTISSWVDWHVLMERQPYRLFGRGDHETRRDKNLRLLEYARLWFDLGIVVLYAYLLFLVEGLSKTPGGSLGGFLFVFVLLYGLYIVSGQMRRWGYGPWASQMRPNIFYGFLFLLTWLIYEATRHARCHLACGSHPTRAQNALFLVLAVLLVVVYRWRRRVFAERQHNVRLAGPVFGIDIDGVLADQVSEILRRANRRYQTNLHYKDVIEWRLPIADTNIAELITTTMDDPDYVLGMPLRDGAWNLVKALYPKGRLYIVTARPEAASKMTRQWLDDHRIPSTNLIHATEGRKHLYALDVLIDDYIGNVRTFLEGSNGAAVLVDQPWNRDRSDLQPFIDECRLIVVDNLDTIPDLLATLVVGPRDVAIA